MFRRIFNKFAISNGIEPLKRNITTISNAEPILPAFDPDQVFEEVKNYAATHQNTHVELPPDLKSGRLKRSDDSKYREIGPCTWLEQKKKMTEAQKEQERYFGDEYAGD